jgi:pyridoxine 5'-phosphate synthase PdxJ
MKPQEPIRDYWQEFTQNGYVWIEKQSEAFVESFVKRLGEVIFETDVSVKPESKALVTSDKALDFHTDHHKADFILWYCVQQTDVGGESILLAADKAFAQLSPTQQAALSRIQLYEHQVFADDKSHFPLIEVLNGVRKYYYSFWLADKNLPEDQKEALNTFQKAIKELQPITLKLQTGDILLIDNRRMLHGRSAIEGSKLRTLRRYWIRKHKPLIKDGFLYEPVSMFIIPLNP